jgi:four helix bundle protein
VYGSIKSSFHFKLRIVVEEIDESLFWIEFIIDENLVKREMCDPLRKEADELTAIFVATRKTAIKNRVSSSIIHQPS